MNIQKIKTDYVYDHERYGQVLVTGIAEMYDEYRVDAANKDGNPPEQTVVFFHDRYDGYGGMSPVPLSQTVNEFGKSVTKEIEEYEYIDTNEWDENAVDPRDERTDE